jgi:hypothetical protein
LTRIARDVVGFSYANRNAKPDGLGRGPASRPIWSALGFIAGLPNGAQIVFDYADPPKSLSPEMSATGGLRT